MAGWKYWNKKVVEAKLAATEASAETDSATAAAAAEETIVTTEITLGTNTNKGFVVCPVAGTVTAIYTVIDDVLTTADETLSFAVTGGTSMGDIVIAYTSSAAGDVDTLAPSANNVVAAGDTIDVTTDGGNATTTTIAKVTVLIKG
jgi:hypothetical protein